MVVLLIFSTSFKDSREGKIEVTLDYSPGQSVSSKNGGKIQGSPCIINVSQKLMMFLIWCKMMIYKSIFIAMFTPVCRVRSNWLSIHPKCTIKFSQLCVYTMCIAICNGEIGMQIDRVVFYTTYSISSVISWQQLTYLCFPGFPLHWSVLPKDTPSKQPERIQQSSNLGPPGHESFTFPLSHALCRG